MMLLAGSFLKFLLGFIGVSMTIILLILSAVRGNSKLRQNAAITFLATIFLLFAITIIEFLWVMVRN